MLAKRLNHVGNFHSYNIDKQSLEAAASDETCIVWERIGEQGQQNQRSFLASS